MMTNEDFLNVISLAFDAFLVKGTSRSSDKLVPLHGAVAGDIARRLGDDYVVISKGYGAGKEAKVGGRYVDKAVDITIINDGHAVAGIAVKFVMQNYSQNSVNYFENMLGETANIRSKGCPYFQIFVILDRLPYYKKDKSISKWESFSEHNVEKYVRLSQDNIDVFFHTPNKTLIYVVHLPDPDRDLLTSDDYLNYYRSHDHSLSLSENHYPDFGPAVILNDYETFIDKVYHTVMSV